MEVLKKLHPINMFKCRSAHADAVSEFRPSPHRPWPSCQLGHAPRRMRDILPKRVRPRCLRKGSILLLSEDTMTSQSSQESVERARVQAFCIRDFVSGFSASIDEIRKFQLSGYSNHIRQPTSGHQILYLLRSWLFHGPWRLVRFKLHIFCAEPACRLFCSSNCRVDRQSSE